MRIEASARDLQATFVGLLPLHLELQRILSERKTIFIGQDVSVDARGQKITPFSMTRLDVRVPEGYFFEEFGEVNELALIRRLLSYNFFSIRSKLAQAGLGFRPEIPSGGSAADIPVTREKNGYKIPITAFSQNPKLSLRLPKDGEFPLFRFVLWPVCYRLSGYDLIRVAKCVGADSSLVKLIDYRGRRISLEKSSSLPSSPFSLSLRSQDSLISAAIRIVRWARFAEEKEIDLEVLCGAKSRGEVDQILGLDWEDSVRDKVEDELEYMIGETPKVFLPSDIAGVINLGCFATEHNGRANHSSSVLIDPGFGSVNGGMPIRTEHVVMQRAGQTRKAPKFLELFFFKVKD